MSKPHFARASVFLIAFLLRCSSRATCLLFSAALLVPPAALALDAGRKITQYGHDLWNYQTGLPGGAVHDVFQLPDGYIWLRQATGLLRFDGRRFTSVVPSIGGSALGEDIRAAALTPDGKLLLRGGSRTVYFHNGEFIDAAAPAKLMDGFERVVAQTRDGTIWIGSDSNVYRFREGRLQLVAEMTGWISAIYEDRQGNVWIAAGSGLYRMREDKITAYPTGYNAGVTRIMFPWEEITGAHALRGSVTTVAEDRLGTLWVGTQSGLYKLREGRLIQDAQTAPFENVQVAAILEDKEGNLWVGTDGAGLFRLTGGEWSSLRSEDGLSDNGVVSLTEDNEGSLWIGTRSGLDRLRDTAVVTITAKEGLSHDNASIVTEAADGSVLVYTYGRGISVLRGGQNINQNGELGLPATGAGALYVARDGTIWMGTDRGLASYSSGTLTYHPGGGILSNSFISCIHENDRGIVFGTSQLQFYTFRDGKFEAYNVGVPPGRERRNSKYVYAMHLDEEGTLWLGMTAGLWSIPKGTAPEDARLSAFEEPVTSIFDDGEGRLWLTGPYLRGFSCLDKRTNRVTHFPPEVGIPVGPIGRIVTDTAGNLWLGTRAGIATLQKQEVADYLSRKIDRLSPRIYGMFDGMKTEECSGGPHQPSAWRARDGKLYFGTRKGVVVVDPERIPKNRRVPPVVIEEFIAEREVIDARPIVLPAGTANVEINYTALSMRSPHRVQFKFQLKGFDRTWVDAGTRRTAYYTRLPPGKYEFVVKACNEDGVWNESGASLPFRVEPHFTQTGWFYVSCTLGVVLSALLLHRFRIRRLRSRETELLAMVDERTSKLRDEILEHTEARRELQRYREYLEQLVAERTAALQSSNLRLQREISERRLSEERYRSFFDEDLAGAFIATPAGLLVNYNPSFARIFSLPERPNSGQESLKNLFPAPAQADELLHKLRDSRKLQNCELEMKRADGRPRFVTANIVGTFATDGSLLEIKGYVLDMTERKRLELELRQSQKMEAIGQLAGGVAHDFNNLLTAIIGSSECIIEDAENHPSIARLAGEIREAGQRAAGLTRQLLAFSRKQVMQPRVLNLNDEVRDMEKMLRRLIGEDIRLELSLAEPLSPVRADPSQTQQIVLNLTVNARDAMPRGGRLLIQTTNVVLVDPLIQGQNSVPPGSYVCLSVSDSGVGMSPEVQAHIFEPFFTTKGVGKGTGLGLSTVYGIVQQSAGYVTFTSEEGKGTTFNVYLPVADEIVVPEKPRGSAPPMPGVGETILVVEDNELVLGVTRRSLEQFGFRVIDANNGRDALERCREHEGRIDLIITDVVMPDMNGRDLADRVAIEFPHIKVLFMSGYTGDALGRAGVHAAAALIEKPFTAEMLLKRVREILKPRA